VATVAEFSLGAELDALRELTESRGWAVTSPLFTLSLPAKDGSRIHFLVRCDRYPELPPAWHFRNGETGLLDQPADTPIGGGFFHSTGVICAPWNRLAYGPGGLHSDWDIGNWRKNPHTAGTVTIPAMVLRLAVELQANYTGRRPQ
jgi:hypothetical protein